MSDATKTSGGGMRIDTPRPHALHPKDAKRTSQDLCAESLCAGQAIAEAVCARTSSPAVSPVCVAVHALVKTHCIRRPDDIRTHFHTVDAFVEWLRTVEAVSGQFKTLKPAFQKYLCDVHGMVQRKTHRSFLDTRDASEAQKALVRKLANTDEQKVQTQWWNVTTLTDWTSEAQMRSSHVQDLYRHLGTLSQQILSKCAMTMTAISKRLLEMGIGAPDDALLCGVQPVGVLTDAQNTLQREFRETMKTSSVSKGRQYLATHDTHNMFIHLLVRNAHLQSEHDIASQGFRVTQGRQRSTSPEVLQTIVNVYRERCGLNPHIEMPGPDDPKALISYQTNALAEIERTSVGAAKWCEAVMRRQRERCIAAKLAHTTIDLYARYTTQMLKYWCIHKRCRDHTDVGTTPESLTRSLVDHVHFALRSSNFSIDECIKRCVAALQHVLGSAAYPFDGKLDAREVATEFRDAHPDMKTSSSCPELSPEDWTISGDVDHRGRDRDYFEETELESLKEHVKRTQDTRMILAFVLLTNTGMRANAIRTLRSSSVWNSTLSVPLDYGHANEKGGQTRMFAIQRDPELAAAVRAHMQDNPILTQKNGYLFPSHVGNIGKPMAKGTLGKWVRAWCQACNLSGKFTHPHSFRKSLIIRLHRLGNSIERIAVFVGHSNPKTTMSFYFTPTVELLTSDMQIPWLKAASNQVTLADIPSSKRLRTDAPPSTTHTSTSSENYFQTFVENNYWPTMKRLSLVDAQLGAAKAMFEKFCTTEQCAALDAELQRCADEASTAAAEMKLDTLMEEGDDDGSNDSEDDFETTC